MSKQKQLTTKLMTVKELIPENQLKDFFLFYRYFTKSKIKEKEMLLLTEEVFVQETEDPLIQSVKISQLGEQVYLSRKREDLFPNTPDLSVIRIFLSLQLEYTPPSYHRTLFYGLFINVAMRSKYFSNRMRYLYLISQTKRKVRPVGPDSTKEERYILSLLPDVFIFDELEKMYFYSEQLQYLSYDQFKSMLVLPTSYLMTSVNRCESYEDFCEIRRKIQAPLGSGSPYNERFEEEMRSGLWKYSDKQACYIRTTPPLTELSIGQKKLFI